MDDQNLAAMAPQDDRISIDYGELAPSIVDELTAQLPAAQLAQTQTQLATQRAVSKALEARVLEARRSIGQLEELGDTQREMIGQLRDRLGELERVVHRAGVVLDVASSAIFTVAKQEHPRPVDQLVLQQIDDEIDRAEDQVVLVDVMALDRLADALRDAHARDVDEAGAGDEEGQA